jgi:DNA-binding CsgD family transcriptional regulator/tetratricopeptide (TPR) repeat protein
MIRSSHSGACPITQLPGPLRLTPSFPFVGRTRELSALRALLPTGDDDQTRIALLSGEAGAGKSRLVRELAHEAASDDGVLVLYGACDADVQAPYAPFVSALEQLERVTEPDELRADLGTTGGELTRLIPDLGVRVGRLPDPTSADPDFERHRLYTAVSELLARVSTRHPLLLVVEDVHWGDPSTLLLLGHLARSTVAARMLLVATYRDTPTELADGVSKALVALRRVEGLVRLRLVGLSDDEVVEFVHRAAGVDRDTTLTELAGAIGRVTDGNPFLMAESWRALEEAGALEDGRLADSIPDLTTPDSLRDVVSDRLSRLGTHTVEVLEVAAVAGADFSLDVVRRATGLDEPGFLTALDDAVRGGMIDEVPGIEASYRFTHELVRRALYDRLTVLRRAELHLRVGTALEAALQEPPRRELADLAHHFAAAGSLDESGRALDYNLQAARSAVGALAFDQAAAHFRSALVIGPERTYQRAEICLELGEACHQASETLPALEAFSEAAEIATGRGDTELLARAAIGFEEACSAPVINDRGAVELLERAAAALGEDASELRVGVLSGLSRTLAFHGEHERAAIVRASATEMARRLGDRRGLANLLARAYWARGTSTLEEIADMLTEARDLADELEDVSLQSEVRAWLAVARMASGELPRANRELTAWLDMAARTGEPFQQHAAEFIASAIALAGGRLDEAEERALRAREWMKFSSGGDPRGIHGIQMFSIRREQGRLDELAPTVRVLAGADGAGRAWRPGLAALLVELGMEEEARRELARIRLEGLEPLRDALWLTSLSYLADAAAATGDEEVAEAVRRELDPFAGTTVMVGHGVAFYGATDRYLGMLDGTLRDWDQAETHFESALELNRRTGAATWEAHTAHEYGRMLIARGRAEDAERSASLLAGATELAEHIGMPSLLQRIAALTGAGPPDAALPDGLSPREAEILRLVARGLSNRGIGEELTISEHTAANHVRSILSKTSCANRTEAASYAHQHGLAERPGHE